MNLNFPSQIAYQTYLKNPVVVVRWTEMRSPYRS